MRELQAEGSEFVLEAEVLRPRQDAGDGASVETPGLMAAIAVSIHSRACFIGVVLALGRAADSEGAVVAGPVAVEGVDDVEEGLVAGPDDAVGEVVRVRVASLARDRVDRLHLVTAELVQSLVRERDDLVLADARACSSVVRCRW